MSEGKNPADLLAQTHQALEEFLKTSRELAELKGLHYNLVDEQQEALRKLSALNTSVSETLEQTKDLEEQTQERCQALADRVELARLQFADQVREFKAQTGLELSRLEDKLQRLGGDLGQLDLALQGTLKRQKELSAKLNWVLVAVAGLAGVLTLAIMILKP